MKSISINMKRLIIEEGRTQKWVIEKMNAINHDLNMDKSKFSAIINGRRNVTGDELIAFCKALEVDPNEFFEEQEEAS